MTFEELLDQVIALLQRRGRWTYRALKRQFNLDDDYLEDLKAKLIQSQRLAVAASAENPSCVGEEAARFCESAAGASSVSTSAPADCQ